MAMVIDFEFLGGCMDGRLVSTHTADPNEATQAQGYYQMTDQGTARKRFWSASDAAIQSLGGDNTPGGAFAAHVYEVVERFEENNHVLVRAKFVELK